METVKLIGHDSPFIVADILWVEASGSYSILHHTNGKQTLVAKPLPYMATKISDLLRIHRSTMVNRECVTGFQFVKRKHLVFTLTNGVTLRASQTYFQKLVGGRLYKPVVNLTTGTYYGQITLAAKALGSMRANLYWHLTGKQLSPFKGNRLRYARPDEIAAKQLIHI